MKRRIFIFAALFAALFSALSFFLFPQIYQRSTRPEQSSKAASTVKVTVDFGDRVATVSSVVATTAFDALVRVTQKEQLELKTKQYDFGVFVEQIGERANTKEKSWIYFVNGKAGTEAADKQPVASGDMVEWRYIEPTVE